MIDRILRAIRLDWTVFREIAEDQKAMTEAMIIVAVVTFLSAVGAGIASRSFGSFIVSWLTAILIGWIGWAVLTYLVGTLLFKGKSDLSEMLRVLGYATAPNLLGFFSFIPCVGWLVALAGSILALIAGVLAIREAMEFETGNAIVTVLISWVISFGITAIITATIGGGAAILSGMGG